MIPDYVVNLPISVRQAEAITRAQQLM